MNKAKKVFVEVNKEFIFVTSFLRGIFSVTDPDQEFIFNPVDISDIELGRLVREKFEGSKEMPAKEFLALFHSEKIQGLQKKLENEMKLLYGYKSRKSIYKDMSFLSLELNDSNISVFPLHQDSLDGFTAILNLDKTQLEFKYDINISDEELGKAVREGLKYCTSIYR
ncbi:contact-dependent growth inhibition system immunity protein [Pasteurella multocida]|uniref:contact-dependent growth inhibition system immunity protein n=1 Tax=Pasteurella multocida TaxID=747 RepID=UPI003310AF6D|nr:CdiI family contact-dependent growth inhibition immunity protein [Pasteurella multocida]